MRLFTIQNTTLNEMMKEILSKYRLLLPYFIQQTIRPERRRDERGIERRIADVKSPIGERGNKRYSPTWKAMRCRNSGSTPSRDRLDTSWYPSFWRNWSCISSGFSSEANLLPDSPPY